jgi:hypothetical protein
LEIGERFSFLKFCGIRASFKGTEMLVAIKALCELQDSRTVIVIWQIRNIHCANHARNQSRAHYNEMLSGLQTEFTSELSFLGTGEAQPLFSGRPYPAAWRSSRKAARCGYFSVSSEP